MLIPRSVNGRVPAVVEMMENCVMYCRQWALCRHLGSHPFEIWGSQSGAAENSSVLGHDAVWMSFCLHSEADQRRMTLMQASIAIKIFVPTHQYVPCHKRRLESSVSYFSEVKSWDISICPRTGKLTWFRRISTFELNVLTLMTSHITGHLYKRYTVEVSNVCPNFWYQELLLRFQQRFSYTVWVS
jgi:hypothetical protein